MVVVITNCEEVMGDQLSTVQYRTEVAQHIAQDSAVLYNVQYSTLQCLMSGIHRRYTVLSH